MVRVGGHAPGVEVGLEALQRGVGGRQRRQGRIGDLLVAVGLHIGLAHEVLEEAQALLGVRRVLAHGQGDVDAGDDPGVGGGVGRGGEGAQVDVGVVGADGGDGVGAVPVHGALALGEALVAVVVAQAGLVGVAVLVSLKHLLEDGGEFGEGGPRGQVGAPGVPGGDAVGEEGAGQGGEGRRAGPVVLGRPVEGVDAPPGELVADADELVPGGGRLQARLGEDVLVVDNARAVVGEGQAVGLALPALAEGVEDGGDGGVDAVEQVGLAEVVEDAGPGQRPVVVVAIDGDQVGHVALDQAGPQGGDIAGLEVLGDDDVGVGGVEVGADPVEEVDGLALELEELEMDLAVAGRAAGEPAGGRERRRPRRGGEEGAPAQCCHGDLRASLLRWVSGSGRGSVAGSATRDYFATK